MGRFPPITSVAWGHRPLTPAVEEAAKVGV